MTDVLGADYWTRAQDSLGGCAKRFIALFLPSSCQGCPGGGIGRRARLKLAFRKECGFDSHPGYREAANHSRLFFGKNENRGRPYSMRVLVSTALFHSFNRACVIAPPQPSSACHCVVTPTGHNAQQILPGRLCIWSQSTKTTVTDVNISARVNHHHSGQWRCAKFCRKGTSSFLALKRQACHTRHVLTYPFDRSLAKMTGPVIVECRRNHTAKLFEREEVHCTYDSDVVSRMLGCLQHGLIDSSSWRPIHHPTQPA